MARVNQCNIRSLNTSTKYVENLSQRENIKVWALTEIWHPDYTKLNYLHQWKWYKNERDEREGGGAALAVHPGIKSWERKDLTVDGVEGVWCEVSISDVRILLGSIYIRPDDEQAMHKFVGQLSVIQRENDNVVVTGDLNAKHNMWYNSDSNKLGEILAPSLLSSQFNLMNNYDSTYRDSIIDLTLAKGCQQYIRDWSAHPDVFVNSDHNLISFDIDLEVVPIKITKWNVGKADWNEYARKVNELNNEAMFQITADTTPDQMYDIIKNNLLSVAEDTFGKINFNGKHKSWWDDELRLKFLDLKRRKRKYKQRSDRSKLEQYLNSKSEFYEIFHEKRSNFVADMVESMDGSQVEMWRMIKKASNEKIRKVIQPIRAPLLVSMVLVAN